MKPIRSWIVTFAGAGLLPVGCLTVTSTLPGAQTMLEAMDDGVKAAFHNILIEGMLGFLSEAASPASLRSLRRGVCIRRALGASRHDAATRVRPV